MHRFRLPRVAVTLGMVVAVAGVSVAVLVWTGPDGVTAVAQSGPGSSAGSSAGSPVWAAACGRTLQASTPGAVGDPAMREVSGVVASRRNPGVWWLHNDSGDSARVFAMGDDGRALGQFTLTGATARDWEDIAVGPGPTAGVSYLYVADIGDNSAARPSVVVYRVPEPAVAGPVGALALSGVEALTLTYPNGPRDAEALLVDPVSGSLVVIAKSWSGPAEVYRAPAGLAPGSATVLTSVGAFPLGTVTGADVTPAGDVVAVRTYGSVVLYLRSPGTEIEAAFSGASCTGPSASEPQGEAVGFLADGSGYVTVSEGVAPPVRRFATWPTTVPTVAPTTPPTTRPSVTTTTTRPSVTTTTTRPRVTTTTTRPRVMTTTTRPKVTATTRPRTGR
ncbi:MAG: hypothetical protein ACKOVH_00535 [Actinomycetota bacterium]